MKTKKLILSTLVLLSLAVPEPAALAQRPRDERGRPAGRGRAAGDKKRSPDAPKPRASQRREKVAPVALDEVESLRRRGRDVRVTWGNRGAARGLYGRLGRFSPSASGAREFLRQHGKAFKLREDVADLETAEERETPGGRRVVFQQTLRGVKVHGARLAVSFDPGGEVVAATGEYFDDIDLESTTPTLGEGEALATLRAAVGEPSASDPVTSELVVFVDEGGAAHLAYRFVQPTVTETGRSATYEGFVDAQTGRLVEPPADINQYVSGRVFAKGNAMASTGDATLRDSSAVPATAYATVELRGLTSPTGLVGQYVDCVSLTPAANRAAPSASGDYLFERSTDPVAGARFDAVQAYYFVDAAQRYVQGQLGFANVVNRSMRIAVNATADDNSFYSSLGNGNGSITLGSGGVDDGEDAEVILHEYGHAMQDNSSPDVWRTQGTAGVSAGTGAMGEGFGDYWAASIMAQQFGQTGTPFETSVMEWDATAYSTASPPTIRPITSTKHFPEAVTGAVHQDGEIWSSTLWQIRGDLGPVAADRVILQSHFLIISPNATFTDGANAILSAADALGYTAAQKSAIRARFEQRGILDPLPPSGSTGGSSTGGSTSGCSSTTAPLTDGASVAGDLSTGDCFGTVGTTQYHDRFTVDAAAGATLTVSMSSTQFDTYLVLRTAAGALLAQDDDSGGGTNSRIAFTPTSAAQLVVEATSYDPRATGQYSVALAVAASAPQAPADLVTNGGFEAGTGWTLSTPSVINNGTPRAYEGTFKASMLGRGYTGSAFAQQAPAFGSSGVSRTLRFYLRIVTSEGTGAAYDKLSVRVLSADGYTLATLATISNVDQARFANWALVSLTVPAEYAAPGNRIRFAASEDSMVPTAFHVDAVSVQ